MISCRTISQYLTFGNNIAFEDDRTLVYTGTLVGAFEFEQRIDVQTAIFTAYANFITYNAFNFTSMFSQYANAKVNSNFILHTGTNDRSLSAQQRNCLTLHVGAHQCTVSVIVFQERNQCSSDGYYLLRRNVH